MMRIIIDFISRDSIPFHDKKLNNPCRQPAMTRGFPLELRGLTARAMRPARTVAAQAERQFTVPTGFMV
nr:hypothetical protein [uncultured Pseudogulbenkiania sp.]